MAASLKNIETLIDEGGNISVGALDPHDCVATADDQHNSLAMLVRRDGEPLKALLHRLDTAIGVAWSDGIFADEVN
jgi:hypothetical protein